MKRPTTVQAKSAVAFVLGIGLVLVAFAFGVGVCGNAPTGMVELIGDKTNQSDMALARWATAGIPFIVGLVILGLVNTKWVSGPGQPLDQNPAFTADPGLQGARDKDLIDSLNKLVTSHQTLFGSLQRELTDLQNRLDEAAGVKALADIEGRLAILEQQVNVDASHPG